MADLTIIGNRSFYNEDAEFFKDVYIYGTLYYDFEQAGIVSFKSINVDQINVLGIGTINDLTVNGISTFNGPVFIKNDLNVSGITSLNELRVSGISSFNGPVFINNNLEVNGISTFTNLTFFQDIVDINELFVNKATVRQRFNVGIGGSTLSATTSTNKVGINSTNPEQTFDVIGNAKILGQLYDSLNLPGIIGDFLSKDAQGIKWVTFEPDFIEGIFVYNDGVLVGVQSFRGLNLKTGRGSGINTDPIQGFVNPSNPNIADIYVYDYWDHNGSGDIYRYTNVGIGNSLPNYDLDVTGEVNIEENLYVRQDTFIDGSLDVDGNVVINSTTGSIDKDTGALVVEGGVGVEEILCIGQDLFVGRDTFIDGLLDVDGLVTFNSQDDSSDKDTGALVVEGGVGIEKNLNVGKDSVFNGTVELDSSLIDINQSTASGKFDYRLSSVGTGVSWRPPGVQTQNAIWVTMDGNDSNSGYLEGDAKRTVGAAASIAQEGDTIFIRSGVYYENNPIGLRTDVTVSGQDLRLVTIIPENRTSDVFHVRRGCLIENLSFAGNNVSIAYTGAAAVAFPPIDSQKWAKSGYISPGPATEGPSGRWRSPYIRNCTNFMTKSIGMKIDGNHATASTIGNDLKCMVCDSFTQYNEAGIGVSITNNGYAQLVSIFTINCDIGIYCDSGGSCDLTNSNSSFGNYGLYAVGLGITEFTGQVNRYPSSRPELGVDAGSDIVTLANVSDNILNTRRPYDGQALFFKIDLSNYPDADGSGILQEPMLQIKEIKVINGGSGYSASNPPTIIIRDSNDLSQIPKGPQGIIAELSPTIDEVTGTITAIDIVNSGRNYLPTQNLEVFIDGFGGAQAELITEPIYYTVDVASNPTPPINRYADAVSLILKNLDFIATESVDRMLYYYNVTLATPFSVPGGSSKCVSDVKLVLKSVAHNLQFGGNDRVYDAAKVYVDYPYLAGEESQSIVTFNYARDLAKEIINNVLVSKQNYSGINVYTQVRDLTLIADPSPSSGSPSNTNPNSCTNVRNAIDTFFAIITTAVNPASSPRLPTSRTVGNTIGITTVIFNEFIPYELFGNEEISLKRISRILTSSHSFEYIGTGTDINTATPFKGAVPIKENEIVFLDGAQIPFTSTDQKGNFDIGEGFQINQPTGTIRGRDFTKAIQAELTPIVIALR